MGKSVIIIGSGIAGLAASIRLAKKGFIVSIFESQQRPGGKLKGVELGNYKFDTALELLTLPHEIDELFELSGLNPSDHFTYQNVDDHQKFFYEDGTSFSSSSNKEAFIRALSDQTKENEDHIRSVLKSSARKFSTYSTQFLNKPLPVGSIRNKIRALQYSAKQPGINKTIHETNSHKLEHCKTKQFFNHYTFAQGSNPFQTPSPFDIHPYIQIEEGSYFPMNGMQAISDELYHLAKQVGVKFYFGMAVEKIVVHSGVAKGVDTKMGFHLADRVVCNASIHSAYKHLLKDQARNDRSLAQPPSSSAINFYWGIKGNHDSLAFQNTFFSGDFEEECRQLFEHQTVFDDPTISLRVTSKLRPEDAPEGCENWSVSVRVPDDTGQDWDMLIQKVRTHIINRLSKILGINVESLIEEEQVIDPRHIEATTWSRHGELFGNSMHSKKYPFLNYPNQAKGIQHLYFCGSSVHPGGGIPMRLRSAKLMADIFK